MKTLGLRWSRTTLLSMDSSGVMGKEEEVGGTIESCDVTGDGDLN